MDYKIPNWDRHDVEDSMIFAEQDALLPIDDSLDQPFPVTEVEFLNLFEGKCFDKVPCRKGDKRKHILENAIIHMKATYGPGQLLKIRGWIRREPGAAKLCNDHNQSVLLCDSEGKEWNLAEKSDIPIHADDPRYMSQLFSADLGKVYDGPAQPVFQLAKIETMTRNRFQLLIQLEFLHGPPTDLFVSPTFVCRTKPRRHRTDTNAALEPPASRLRTESSTSAVEDGAYADYDVTVQKLGKECEDLETERLSQPKDGNTFGLVDSEKVNDDEPFQQEIIFFISDKNEAIHFPAGGAFLKFPARTVSNPVTLTCTRIKHKDYTVKPRKGDVFCSNIVQLQPENITFDKSVIVLLSHSAVEDGAYADYYDLTVQKLGKECEDLETERLSQPEDLTEVALDFHNVHRNLPLAKTSIQGPCTLVVASRIRSEEIVLEPDEMYLHAASYGDESELEILFPVGSVETKCVLTIQVIPTIDAVNVEQNDEVICFPTVNVYGRDKPFLKPVEVEFWYSSDNVATMADKFLSVGKTLPLSSCCVLFHSHKNQEGNLVWQNVDNTSNATIERCKKNQLKISLRVSHFCQILTVVKKNENVNFDNLHDVGSRPKKILPGTVAVCSATQGKGCRSKPIGHALLAPRYIKEELEAILGSAAETFCQRVKDSDQYFFCIQLSEQEHLHNPENRISFFEDVISKQPYFVERDVVGHKMVFTPRECDGKRDHHDDFVGKCQIISRKEISVQCDIDQADPVQQLDLQARSKISKRMEIIKKRSELFEERIEYFFKKIQKNESKSMEVGVPVAATFVSIGCGMAIRTFGITPFVGAAIAVPCLVVRKIDKIKHKNFDRISEALTKDDLYTLIISIVKDVAKELCRVFEDQLFKLNYDSDVTAMANFAAGLLLKMKEEEEFSRNNLLKKVVLGKTNKNVQLKTRRNNKTWNVPDVFQKPGLRKEITTSTQEEVKKVEVKFKYLKKPNDTCDAETYGYRGQILEMVCVNSEEVDAESEGRNGCSEESESIPNECAFCCDSDEDGGITYFKESNIDRQFTENCSESNQYQPFHCLVQCPGILASFVCHKYSPTIKNHVGEMYFSDRSVPVKPVYRSHSSKLVSSLSNTDLSGSDFSHVCFANCNLEECHFTDCTIMFGELKGVNLRGSCFIESRLTYCNLESAKAQKCKWTATKVHYCCFNNTDLTGAVSVVGGKDWMGTNLNQAKTGSLPGEPSQMVRDIPYLVRVEICRLLNIRTDRRDFRTLAGILQMKTSDIQLLSQKDDPTDDVLKWWEPKNSATLQRFREILREMHRDNVVQILDEYRSGRHPEITAYPSNWDLLHNNQRDDNLNG